MGKVLGGRRGRTVSLEGFLIRITLVDSLANFRHRAVDEEEFINAREKSLGAVFPQC